MTAVITCPSCRTRLRVPEGSEASGYTCPRCLGEIRISGDATGPVEGIVTTPARETTRAVPERTLPERSDAPLCRSCFSPLTDSGWRYCPGCGTPVVERGDLPRRRDALDEEVTRDGRRTGWFTVTLLVLGILALFTLGLGSLGAGPGGFVAFLFFMLILAAVVWGVVYSRTRTRPDQLTAGRVARGVVLTVGAFVFGYIVLGLVALGCVVLAFLF